MLFLWAAGPRGDHGPRGYCLPSFLDVAALPLLTVQKKNQTYVLREGTLLAGGRKPLCLLFSFSLGCRTPRAPPPCALNHGRKPLASG